MNSVTIARMNFRIKIGKWFSKTVGFLVLSLLLYVGNQIWPSQIWFVSLLIVVFIGGLKLVVRWANSFPPIKGRGITNV